MSVRLRGTTRRLLQPYIIICMCPIAERESDQADQRITPGCGPWLESKRVSRLRGIYDARSQVARWFLPCQSGRRATDCIGIGQDPAGRQRRQTHAHVDPAFQRLLLLIVECIVERLCRQPAGAGASGQTDTFQRVRARHVKEVHPHLYIRTAYVCALSVCPSVRPSVRPSVCPSVKNTYFQT